MFKNNFFGICMKEPLQKKGAESEPQIKVQALMGPWLCLLLMTMVTFSVSDPFHLMQIRIRIRIRTKIEQIPIYFFLNFFSGLKLITMIIFV